MPPVLVMIFAYPSLMDKPENVPLTHNISESWSPVAGLKRGADPILPRHTHSRFRANVFSSHFPTATLLTQDTLPNSNSWESLSS